MLKSTVDKVLESVEGAVVVALEVVGCCPIGVGGG